MPVLVVYASKHGATREIAERVAQTMAAAGQQAQARPVMAAGDLTGYDAFVVGSAVYMGHWQKEAAEFVRCEGDFRDWAQIEAWARGIARDPALGTGGADRIGAGS